jgi:hypothetical protein
MATTNTPAQSPALPKPGVYKSIPYTCLIIVPSGQLDTASIFPPSNTPPMPQIEPKLDLIPYFTAKP